MHATGNCAMFSSPDSSYLTSLVNSCNLGICLSDKQAPSNRTTNKLQDGSRLLAFHYSLLKLKGSSKSIKYLRVPNGLITC